MHGERETIMEPGKEGRSSPEADDVIVSETTPAIVFVFYKITILMMHNVTF